MTSFQATAIHDHYRRVLRNYVEREVAYRAFLDDRYQLSQVEQLLPQLEQRRRYLSQRLQIPVTSCVPCGIRVPKSRLVRTCHQRICWFCRGRQAGRLYQRLAPRLERSAYLLRWEHQLVPSECTASYSESLDYWDEALLCELLTACRKWQRQWHKRIDAQGVLQTWVLQPVRGQWRLRYRALLALPTAAVPHLPGNWRACISRPRACAAAVAWTLAYPRSWEYCSSQQLSVLLTWLTRARLITTQGSFYGPSTLIKE